MKKYIYLVLSVLVITACTTKNSSKKEATDVKENRVTVNLETAIIYEANIRQYSPEGTFSQFTKDIPELKKLGVTIIWLMPIHPISTTKSKGSLGSYYAVSDYTGVNPEFGNLDDLKNLVKVAHENNMYVILDWVANHTGWDHIWLKNNPEFYTKNKKGEITHTVGTDWTDVADLNFDNQEMRTQMLNAMKFWVEEVNIDGFRCDVAGMVPLDFWENATTQLEKIKPLFMLAEAWESELLINAFDMAYGWDTHHKMNAIAQGKETVKAWDKRMVEINTMYQKDDILMNFITNHDENSWNGTIKERMGNAAEAMLALSYCTPGMPLIYSGQEYDMNHRLKFFEKDSIPKTKGKAWALLEKLAELKIDNKALHGGKKAASYTRIKSSNDKEILVFSREKDADKIIYIANLSENEVTFTIEKEGTFTDFLTNKKSTFSKEKPQTFKAWEYKILIQ